MKKLIVLFCAFLFTFTLNGAFANYTIEGGAKTKRLHVGTKIPVKMAEPVTTSDFAVGDMFSATITNDIILDNSVILPAGTLVRGNIARIKPAKRLSRAANLYLTFDHIVTPQGRQLPIKAGLSSNFKLTMDGGITSGGNYGYAVQENWKGTKNIVRKSTQWGLNSGEKLFTGAQIITTPVAAVGGVLVGGGYFIISDFVDLIKKGDEVIINQGQVFGIMLLAPLDVPVG